MQSSALSRRLWSGLHTHVVLALEDDIKLYEHLAKPRPRSTHKLPQPVFSAAEVKHVGTHCPGVGTGIQIEDKGVGNILSALPPEVPC